MLPPEAPLDGSPPASAWLTVKDLAAALRISRTTLFTYLRQGRVPRPVYFTARTARWNRKDVADVLRTGPRPEGWYAPVAPPAVAEEKPTSRADRATARREKRKKK